MKCPVCSLESEEVRELSSFTTLSLNGLPVFGNVTIPDGKIVVTTYECSNCKSVWKNKRQYGQVVAQDIVISGEVAEESAEPVTTEEELPVEVEDVATEEVATATEITAGIVDAPDVIEVQVVVPDEPTEETAVEAEPTQVEAEPIEVESLSDVIGDIFLPEVPSLATLVYSSSPQEVPPPIQEPESFDVIEEAKPEDVVEGQPEPSPSITSFTGEYAFLSNFTECKVEFNGLTFRNSEAAFQSAKVVGDPAVFTALTGAQAKSLGRQSELRADWEEIKDEVMYQVLLSKFSTGNLKNKLLATKDLQIIEENTYGDTYWGVCNGEGQNKLGLILMRIRSELGG